MVKIISGGQTGVDRMGLEVARKLGLETGGTAPKGYKTEKGPDLVLYAVFKLSECKNSNYATRTKQNVIDSTGTVLYGNIKSTGTRLTISYCKTLNKPFIVNPKPIELSKFIEKYNIKILNVAGNRASTLLEPIEKYRDLLERGLMLAYLQIKLEI